MFLIHGGSRHKMNGLAKHGTHFKENFERLYPGMQWAHFDTINNLICATSVDDLCLVRKRLVQSLIRQKVLRTKDGYHHIIFDGTGICSYKQAPVDKASYKKRNDTITYYAYVLEAKLLTNENMVLSVASEMINNEGKKAFDKQDSELAAFKRLAAKVDKYFPRLPICIHLDGLYANGPVMEICEQYGWKYIITRKDGCLKDLDVQIIDKTPKEKQSFRHPINLNPKCKSPEYVSYKWVERLTHQLYQFNYMEQIIPIYNPKEDTVEATKFAYITNLDISRTKAKQGDSDEIEKAIIQLINCGRMRWKIENEGFNMQKNGGLNMQHKFVRRSITNQHKYYILLQIAHIIIQLTLKSKTVASLLDKDKTISIKLLWSLMISIITVSVLNQQKLLEGRVKCQIRLE